MEKYSHGAFPVTGVISHIPSHAEAMPIIMDAWKQRFANKTGASVVGQSHPSMHAVYYNYDVNKTSFDMLVGVMVEENIVQTNDNLTTLIIPAQDYRYIKIAWGFPDSIWNGWDEINKKTAEELPRTYGYDLEMYNEAGDECTIAVSVKE